MINSVRTQLRDLLSKRIADLPCGDRLPPERALAQEYGVSRDTVRRVLQEFSAQGMISSMPGIGYMRLDMELGQRARLAHGVVGLILATSGVNTFDARMLIGFESGIKETGNNFTIHATHSVEEEGRMIGDFISRGAPGIAIAYWGGNGQQNNVAQLTDSGTPFIALERFLVGHESSYVASDEEKCMSSAVAYLADRGHRHIVYVSNASDCRFSSSVERRTSFRSALETQGVLGSELEDCVVNVGANRLPGAVTTLCARKPRVTAYCCDSWLVARFIDCLHRNGARVPDDVEVVSVGGMPCEVTVPAMITDTYEIGYRGALRLAELMNDPHADVEERVAPISALHSAGDEYYRQGRSGGTRHAARGAQRLASGGTGRGAASARSRARPRT